jgi:hypothetical protein
MTHAAEHDPVPPACRPFTDRLQRALDGEPDPAALEADPHPAACPACRERVAAARLLLSVLAAPAPVAPPAGLADAIVAAVNDDRYARIRRRSYAVSVGVVVALAASVMLVAWHVGPSGRPARPEPVPFAPDTARGRPEPAPEPREVAPRPVRIGDEFARMGDALRGAPKPIADPAALAPDVVARLTAALTPPAPDADPFAPARAALGELPDAARAGLEPVAATAQKAFSRLLRDVGAVGAKPKS